MTTTFRISSNGDDQPEPGKIYRLTGGRDTPSVARGDALKDCEVESESKPVVKLESVKTPTGKVYQAFVLPDLPIAPQEPAVTPTAGWGQCRDCGVPGICDGSGMGLSCGCGF